MFPKLKSTLSILLSLTFLLVSSVEGSIVRRDTTLTPGTYLILPLSVPGFQLGVVPGTGSSPSLVEVQTGSDNDSAIYDFTVARFGDVYTIEVASGAVVPNGNTSVGVVPGDFPLVPWTIQLVEGFFTITSADGLGWILPHDAPVGTPVSLDGSNPPVIPAQLFEFASA